MSGKMLKPKLELDVRQAAAQLGLDMDRLSDCLEQKPIVPREERSLYHFTASLGGHRIGFACRSERILQCLVNAFRPEMTEGRRRGQCDMQVVVYENYGKPFPGYEVQVSSDRKSVRFDRGDYLIKADKSFSRVEVHAYDEFALKHAILTLYSSFIIHREWGLLIQACSFEMNETAHVLMGPADSRQASVPVRLYPHQLLSDEVTILQITDREVRSHHSPFRREKPAVQALGDYPVKQMCLISEDDYEPCRLNQADAMFHLIRYLYFWGTGPTQVRKLLQLCKKFTDHVAVLQIPAETQVAAGERIV
ncbi:hypothetical protein ACFQWB_13530 [Paenibacillus thermoaerophilus]|uniref:Uncharacterized protein n=1 Tax=Paenibacillus thermoaerophilus TaxID=1215385 RepID=A0ABW2V9H0_9BACL|nr:hypothetical protein [Paenibacillus thermoaerophilus]TMV16152.1 hypothetical protein FE781_08790 [Paenibacillus thermoaerophilus]